jgi:hypothetical protein
MKLLIVPFRVTSYQRSHRGHGLQSNMEDYELTRLVTVTERKCSSLRASPNLLLGMPSLQPIHPTYNAVLMGRISHRRLEATQRLHVLDENSPNWHFNCIIFTWNETNYFYVGTSDSFITRTYALRPSFLIAGPLCAYKMVLFTKEYFCVLKYIKPSSRTGEEACMSQ